MALVVIHPLPGWATPPRGTAPAPAVAVAEAVDPPEKVEAKALRDAGVTAYEAGDYLGALEKFEAAYAKVPSPNLRFNLGRVLSELGRDLEAPEAFEAFLRDAPNAPDDARGFARAKIAVLEHRVARLAIKASVAGAGLTLDGKGLGTAPLDDAVRVNPGLHQLAATAPGHVTAVASVNPHPGERLTVELSLLRFGAAPRPVYKKWWFWTAIVASAGAVGAGTYLAVRYGTPTPPEPDATVTPSTANGLTDR